MLSAFRFGKNCANSAFSQQGFDVRTRAARMATAGAWIHDNEHAQSAASLRAKKVQVNLSHRVPYNRGSLRRMR